MNDAPLTRDDIARMYDVPPAFLASVAESLIGQPIAVDVEGAGRHAGTIVAAKVTDDGRALLMTVEQAPGPSLFLGSVADLFDPPQPFTEHPPTVEVRRPPDTD